MIKEVEYSAQEIVDNISREKVANLEPEFANLMLVLERAFENIK